MNVYFKGATVRLKATFTDPDTDALVDPTSVVITVKDPSGTTTTPTVTQDATGIYVADVTVSTPGTWTWQAEGIGTHKGLFIASFKVKESGF